MTIPTTTKEKNARKCPFPFDFSPKPVILISVIITN